MQSCCPFDRAHVVDSAKLLKHIQKCRSPNREDFKPCPYNGVHWLRLNQIEKHIQSMTFPDIDCPDKHNRRQPSL
jgi:hypothetical protein